MTYILEKPILRAAAVGLIVTVAADAYDGTKDFSFKGAPNLITAVTSASSLNAALVPNPISGPAYHLVPPENQHVGKLLLNYVQADPLNQPQPLLMDSPRPFGSTKSTLSSQVTDVSGGQEILRGWPVRST